MASKNEKPFTLVFVKNENGGNPQILLGLKMRGLDEGLWNGFGGKVENHESILDGARRELREECGLTGELRKLGALYVDGRKEDTIFVVHVFDTYSDSETFEKSEEMTPQWFRINEIPYGQMKTDVPYWFDHMLNGNFFKACFRYEGDELVYHNVVELNELEEN